MFNLFSYQKGMIYGLFVVLIQYHTAQLISEMSYQEYTTRVLEQFKAKISLGG